MVFEEGRSGVFRCHRIKQCEDDETSSNGIRKAEKLLGVFISASLVGLAKTEPQPLFASHEYLWTYEV